MNEFSFLIYKGMCGAVNEVIHNYNNLKFWCDYKRDEITIKRNSLNKKNFFVYLSQLSRNTQSFYSPYANNWSNFNIQIKCFLEGSNCFCTIDHYYSSPVTMFNIRVDWA